MLNIELLSIIINDTQLAKCSIVTLSIITVNILTSNLMSLFNMSGCQPNIVSAKCLLTICQGILVTTKYCWPNVCWPNVRAYQCQPNIMSAKCQWANCQGMAVSTKYYVFQMPVSQLSGHDSDNKVLCLPNVCWANVKAYKYQLNIG